MTGSLHAGGARTEVTPEGAVPLGGYGAEKRLASGVHDPLYATTLVLDDGATSVAIVSIDLLNVSWTLGRRVRRRLVDGGPLDEVLLVATHTHAGPHVPAPAIDVNPLLAVDKDVTSVVERVVEGVTESVRGAVDAREPATLRVGRAENDTSPVNRRAAGGVGGSLRLPSGSIDPECVVVDVETETGTEWLLYNFACHPVCTTPGETLVSADWPHYARESVEAETGATTLFCNGAAADVNPRDRYAQNRAGERIYEYMADVGEEIATTVLDARGAARSASPVTAPLTVDAESLRLPVKATPDEAVIRAHLDTLDERIDRLDESGTEVALSSARADRRYAREMLALARWDANRLPARTTYVELGDLGLLGLPGEIFVEHGLAFKNRARVDALCPLGYTDGYVGYVPPLHELENGGYEVQTAKISPAAIEQLRETATDLVADT